MATLVLALALAGCPIKTETTTTAKVAAGASVHAGGGTSAPSRSSVSSASTGSGERETESESPDNGSGIRGAIVRRQLEALRGLSPDQAKQQLKKLGHDGEVRVSVVTDYGGGQTYMKECGENKVCYTSGESGIGLHDGLILFINPTLTIAPPPP